MIFTKFRWFLLEIQRQIDSFASKVLNRKQLSKKFCVTLKNPITQEHSILLILFCEGVSYEMLESSITQFLLLQSTVFLLLGQESMLQVRLSASATRQV